MSDSQDTSKALTPTDVRNLVAVAKPVAEETPPPRFRGYTPTELGNLPPVSWQVDGYITQGGLTVVYGPSGGGKTFLALDLSMSISLGNPWNERLVKRGPVVYWCGEGVSGIKKRTDAWKAHNGKEHEPDNILFVPDSFNLLSGADLEAFISYLKELPEPPALVVLDTLARCLVGGDENSAQDMGLAIHAAGQIQKALGASVMIVHHTAKNTLTERGSGALRGAADTMILVDNKGGFISVSCEKQKDAAPFESSEWRLHQVEQTDSCVPVRLFHESASKKQAKNDLKPNDQTVLEVVRDWTERDGGIHLSGISKITGLNKGSSLPRSLERLKAAGYILFDSENGKYHVGRSGRSVPGEQGGTERGNADVTPFRSVPHPLGVERAERWNGKPEPTELALPLMGKRSTFPKAAGGEDYEEGEI